MFDIEKFITEIQAHECIWNLESPSYHNKMMKKNAWIKVFNSINDLKFDSFHPDEQKEKLADLQRKWKNIRDQYKKSLKLPTGSGLNRTKKPYAYSKMLDFLIPVMENRRNEINFENEPEVIVESDSDDNLSTRIDDAPDLPMKSPVKKKKKRFQDDKNANLLDRLLERLNRENREEDDADKLFLLSLLPQIRELNSTQKNYLYISFLETIQRLKFNYPQFGEQTPKNYRTDTDSGSRLSSPGYSDKSDLTSIKTEF